MNKIDRYLLIMGIFLVLFIAAVFYVFLKVGSEPTVLVAGVVGAVIAEIIVLMRIKIGKPRQNYRDKNGE